MARMTPQQRRLWNSIRQSIADVDGVSRQMEADILRLIRSMPSGPMNDSVRRQLMREVERVINTTYGLTQLAAPQSTMYRTITRHMQRTILSVYAESWGQLRRTVISVQGEDGWRKLNMRLTVGTPGTEPGLVDLKRMLEGDHVAQQRLLRSNALDPNRRWVSSGRQNSSSGYRLSDRLWKIGTDTRRSIDDALREGIRLGADPIQIARDLEQHLNENARSLATYRADGTVIRKNMTAAPRSGWGNSHARTLARTEIIRVNGAATIESAKVVPGIKAIRWALSNRHTDIDECTTMARQDQYGLGSGCYPVNAVPSYPLHPNDLCTLVHVSKSREDVVREIVNKYKYV